MFTGTLYFIPILAITGDIFNSIIRWHSAPGFNWIAGLY